jgi:hypothetical protein
MNRLEHNLDSGFHAALSAPARATDIDAADDLYGWLIGSWDMDVVHYRVDLGSARRRGEIHFGWVLEGRAVQDVWIMPPLAGQRDAPTPGDAMYGRHDLACLGPGAASMAGHLPQSADRSA